MGLRRLKKLIVCLSSTFIACYLSLYLRFGSHFKDMNVFWGVSIYQILVYLIASLFLVFVLYPFKVGDNKRPTLRHLKDSIIINFFMALMFTLFIYLSHFSTGISRKFTLYFFAINTLLMFLGFRIFRSLHDRYSSTHKRRTYVFTTMGNAHEVVENIKKYGPSDIQIDALISVDDGNYKVYLVHDLGDYQFEFHPLDTDFIDVLKKEIVDIAYISLSQLYYKDTKRLIELLDIMGITSYLSLSNFNIADADSKMVKSGMLNVIEYAPRIFTKEDLFLKRLLDIIGSLIGCFICFIVGIFVAPMIYFEDHGPVIFKQKRVGRNGRYFYMYKFRSMYTDAEERKKDLMSQNEMNGFMFKMENDPRVTKVGKFLRKTSLDEFPQFFNVLKGDMSLVGTRPPTVDEFKQYDTHHKRRLSIKPGITGMWQVSGRSNITDFEEIVRLDTYYIDNWSVGMDLHILFKTISSVLKEEGSK